MTEAFSEGCVGLAANVKAETLAKLPPIFKINL
jgi:hypothetical protein